MMSKSWFHKVSTRSNQRPKANGFKFRPALTALEGREVPSFTSVVPNGDGGESVVTDAQGDVYMMGNFTTSFTPAGANVALNSVGGSDIFIAKYARDGEFQWAISMGGSNADEGMDMAVSDSGNVVISGRYFETINIGSNVLMSPNNGQDGFAASLSGADGSVNWARNNMIAPLGRVYRATGIDVDNQDNTYVVGQVALSQSVEVAIIKLDSTGNTIWAKELVGITSKKTPIAISENASIEVADGQVLVSGLFTRTVDFDPGSNSATLTSPLSNGFVLKLTTAGTYSWARAFLATSTGGLCYVRDITVDGSGSVYTTGNFSGSIDFDPAAEGKGNTGKLVLNSSSGSAFVSKLNASGNFVWARNFAGSIGSANSLAVDTTGVYMAGSFTGAADFNPGSGTVTLTSAGDSDAFVAKLDTSGIYQWAVRAGGASQDGAFGIAVNYFGDIFVTGYIGAGTTDFDPANTYPDNRDLITATERTGFLWQIGQP